MSRIPPALIIAAERAFVSTNSQLDAWVRAAAGHLAFADAPKAVVAAAIGNEIVARLDMDEQHTAYLLAAALLRLVEHGIVTPEPTIRVIT